MKRAIFNSNSLRNTNRVLTKKGEKSSSIEIEVEGKFVWKFIHDKEKKKEK